MIRIENPRIEFDNNGYAILKSLIYNDSEWSGARELFYLSSIENGKYFCNEVADAFVLPMILRAVKTHQDIVVESGMSEKLFYNLNDSVLYAVSKAYEKKYGVHPLGKEVVRVKCEKLIPSTYNPTAVGTGCSLGVDSFAVLLQNLFSDDCPSSYRVTHLTLFNAGAFGSRDVEGARRSFRKEVERTKAFADKIRVPFVWVDSNTRSFFPELSFDWCHTYLNMGIVLSMQKLWKKYLYAAGYSVDNSTFDISYSAKYEPYLLPHLSTESTELISASMSMRRSDKVAYISDSELVQKELYVCLKEQILNNPQASNKYYGEFKNCGHCKKCLRTMLQLEILGKLDLFKDIFDMKDWCNMRENYIAEVIVGRKENLMLADLYQSMIDHHYAIPHTSEQQAKRIERKKRIQSIKKRIGLNLL